MGSGNAIAVGCGVGGGGGGTLRCVWGLGGDEAETKRERKCGSMRHWSCRTIAGIDETSRDSLMGKRTTGMQL